MAGRAPTVFISSTAEDLKAYRSAARDAAIQAKFWPEMQEYFESKDNPPLAECMERVRRADVIVVFSAYRFGWIPVEGDGKSITWLECLEAEKAGKEVLAFVVDKDAEWPDELKEEYALMVAAREGSAGEVWEEVQKKVDGLKQYKQWLNGRAIRETFKNTEDLRGRVYRALDEWRKRHPEFGEPLPAQLPPSDPTRYLEALREETAWIDIRGLQVGEGKAHRFPIDELYIPLVDELGGGRQEMEMRGGGPVSLDAALGRPRLVITGDPGSGKSTFLKRIAHAVCGRLLAPEQGVGQALPGMEKTPLPVLISIAELAEFIEYHHARRSGEHPASKDAPTWLIRFLGSRSEAENWGLREEEFDRRVKEGPCILLLDGLDEAPTEEIRENISRLAEKAARAWTKCRFVVASRPQAYTGDAVLGGFHHARIGGLEPEAVRAFLERWSSALFPESAAKALRHRDELVEAVESRADVRRIARNPVMLTALAVLHWNEKRLPEQRADLYESVLGWLSKSRKRRPGRASPERCLTLLQELALAMHNDRRGRQVQAPREWAALTIAPQFREIEHERERILRARAFLAEEELDSGIVVRRGEDIRFWHLTFQEHLAGRALAGVSEAELSRILFDGGKLYSSQWRETVLLLAGLLLKQGPAKVDGLVSEILVRLGESPTLAEEARCVGLIGAMLRDLEAASYKLADARYDDVLRRVLGIFDAERAGAVDLKTRLEAAEALGAAGDPRLRTPKDIDYWVTIPDGKLLAGNKKREESVGAFQIGRFPVTVQEYRSFVEDDGYRNAEWWEARMPGSQSEPWRWDDQIEHPNHPVEGISWYEAAAFCKWAGVRLPSSEEWERAAGGPEQREYPWGDEPPDIQRANFFDAAIGGPSPVGLFPLGATPEGIHDLGGNVWEWTRSRWESKPEEMCLCGGSYEDPASGLRASCRSRFAPGDWGYAGVGFRCARKTLT